MKPTTQSLFIFGMVVALFLGVITWRLVQGPVAAPPPDGLEYVISAEPSPLPTFALTDQEGKTFGPERFHDRWTLLFFGYTHCPDVCPTTMAMLKGMRQKLAESHPDVLKELQVYFVSLDPKRDTPAGLKSYVQFFEPSFIGATGSQESIDKITRDLRVAYMVDGDTSGNDYVVNHSANILIIDPKGRVFGQIGPPHTPAGLVDTFTRVRNFYNR